MCELKLVYTFITSSNNCQHSYIAPMFNIPNCTELCMHLCVITSAQDFIPKMHIGLLACEGI